VSVDLKTLRALPKVELHRHLEGSLRAETLWEFHQRQNQNLHSSFEALKAAWTVARGERPGFTKFLSRFGALSFKFGGLDAFERLAREAVADAAEDGVVHLEISFNPIFAARRMKPCPPGGWTGTEPDQAVEEAAAAIVQGARNEAARRQIGIIFILAVARDRGMDVGRSTLALLGRPVGAHFSALDLVGHESVPAAPFREFFEDSRKAGRKIMVHAGEDPSGPGAANVREALHDFKALRIAHGLRAVEDAALVGQLAKADVSLDMCPTSNFQTLACRSLKEHPLKALLEAGVRTTINTDDPAISLTTLSEEYLRALNECGLSVEQLRQCAINAAQSSFVSENEKVALVRRVINAWSKAR
jgi:adenosine deaminase